MKHKRTLVNVYPANIEKAKLYAASTGCINLGMAINHALSAYFAGQSHAKLSVPDTNKVTTVLQVPTKASEAARIRELEATARAELSRNYVPVMGKPLPKVASLSGDFTKEMAEIFDKPMPQAQEYNLSDEMDEPLNVGDS